MGEHEETKRKIIYSLQPKVKLCLSIIDLILLKALRKEKEFLTYVNLRRKHIDVHLLLLYKPQLRES